MRVAIYTAIFGSYDFLKPPLPQDGVDADFYCFTDDQSSEQNFDGWLPQYVATDPTLHPRMQAKRFKLMSHEVFPGGRLAFKFARTIFRRRYDATIWIDASLRLKSKHFAKAMVNLCDADAYVVYRHPDRDCVLEELTESLKYQKYANLPLKDQVDFYVSKGLLAHDGLYACTVIGRRCPESRAVKQFNKSWWTENVDWTYQDQLSFAFLSKREKAIIKIIPGNLWKNDFFEHVPHRSSL